MMGKLTPVEEVVPEKNIIILSPHYDDVPLTFGGYLDALVRSHGTEKKRMGIVQIFSLSNYQNGDDKGNKDLSRRRMQQVTGIRLTEDLACMDDIFGHGNYFYEIKGERECLLRGKELVTEGTFEYLPGSRDFFDEKDLEIYENIKKSANEWLARPDTAILLPMAMKEHIDHMILREGVMDAMENMREKVRAVIYLGEDQPYTGLANVEDWKKARDFLDKYTYDPIDYPIDLYSC